MIIEYRHIHAQVKYSASTKTYYGEFVFREQNIIFLTSQREDLKTAMHAAIEAFVKN